MNQKKANAKVGRTLQSLQTNKELGIARTITFTYRANKVTASCKIGRRNFSGVGQHDDEALINMEVNVLAFQGRVFV